MTAPRLGYRAAVEELRFRQKTSKGAPAYSRFFNRPLGRRLAALAHVAGLSPDQVTALSALASFTGIALVALAPPTVPVAIAVGTALVLGYALDSADGQLARLAGGGSPAGEWLDHVVDAIKLGTLHLAVVVAWYRHFDVPEAMLLVPLGFLVVQSVLFFAMVLTDALRRAARGQREHFLAHQGSSSTFYSLAVVPTDYGLMCLLFFAFAWREGFIVGYSMLAAAMAGFMLLALPKWYLELRRMGREAAAASVVRPASDVSDIAGGAVSDGGAVS